MLLSIGHLVFMPIKKSGGLLYAVTIKKLM